MSVSLEIPLLHLQCNSTTLERPMIFCTQLDVSIKVGKDMVGVIDSIRGFFMTKIPGYMVIPNWRRRL